MTMGAPYHRSPVVAWLIAMTGFGWVFLLSRMASDINVVSARRMVDPSFFETLLGLLLGLYFVLLLILSTFDVRDLLFRGDAGGLVIAVLVIAVSTVVAFIGSLISFHLQITRALGERSGIGGVLMIVAMTVPFFVSVPYLQHRLNVLGRGRSQGLAGAPA